MPTYAYACKDCGHTFDAVQSFTDDALTVCPECQGTLRKKFGAVGVSFKGSGFYRTDSRSSSSSSVSNSSSSTGSSSSSSTSSSTKAATSTS
ncbi:FmdB family zinc ribbon protein [Citricoccus muralis]|uniref:Zinc ribbon domain-containing protein n=1 Tax=Citricoccus muralis TaxID=169134 RepID=A0ABY8H528_9MICC|nr:FmdB family zinc ribbon protein [Citricoccus muralis]WFP15783.1 zinc ribbon domain-containing protein [Citricoccus muralis]